MVISSRAIRLSFLAGLWLAAEAWACQICVPFPTQSVADHLLASSTTVLARENPDAPFTLTTATVLAGDPEAPPLELFLDSHSRRLLHQSPDKSIVCVYQAEAEPPAWRRIGIDHGELRPLVEAIHGMESHWESQPEDRPRFFAPYLGHEDPQIATLAYLEVARAPYSQIRELAAEVPVVEVRSYLANFRYIEWHALYILFLAQSPEAEDQQRIVSTFESNAEFSLTLQSAAWATACIEISPSTAMDRIDQLYFANPGRSPEEIDAIHTACSVQGSNTPGELQDRIIQSYQLALEHHPSLAPRIVADLTKWNRSDLNQAIVDLLGNPSDLFSTEETLQLRAYVRESAPVIADETVSSPKKWIYVAVIAGLLALPYLFRLMRIRRS